MNTLRKALAGPALPALLPAAALAALAALRPWMEASMARHMGLELPLLFLIGCWVGSALGDRAARRLAPWNALGLPGLLAVQAVLAFWMLPAALDAAVLSPAVALGKVASVLAAGLAARWSWPRAGTVLQAFFVINASAMTLTVGLLYRSAPQQLCSVYLADEQAAAGAAMLAWAVLALGLWQRGLVRQLLAIEAAGSTTGRHS